MISVVVCTYNRADMLRQMLEAFFAQRDLAVVDHELIVVDNNSSDNTPVVVDEFRRFPNIRYVFEGRQGLCYARNRGVTESRGEIVALLDDDVIVDKAWLVKLQECFDATTADVVGGRSHLVFEREPHTWFGPYFGRLLAQVDLGPSRKVVPDGRGLFGLNLAFRKSVFETVGLFDQELDRKGGKLLGGGDTAKVRQIAESAGTVVYDPDAVVGHL
ncbi:MAG: glycosyltransferase family 2 protein, partial [Phycisphaerales bacterium]